MSKELILNTIEDIERAFPDDMTARKYLANLRWGQWAACPYCGNSKAYFIDNGKRYKCANNKCYKKFSITVKTMFEASNLSIDIIIRAIFLYVKTRGRCLCSDIMNVCDVSNKSEFFLRDKLDYIWPYISRDGKSNEQIMNEMFLTSISLYDKFIEFKSLPYYKNPLHISDSDINNISDLKQYNILLRYTHYFINVWCKRRKIIWMDFASPAEILSEVFIEMNKLGIKEYNTTYVLRLIWRISSRMWVKFLNEHPKYNEWIKKKAREYKRNKVLNLKDSYIIDAIQKSKSGNGMSWKQIKDNKLLIEQKRNEIKKKRDKSGKLYDFESHFS